jgi:SAM-dependent methyltransferase
MFRMFRNVIAGIIRYRSRFATECQRDLDGLRWRYVGVDGPDGRGRRPLSARSGARSFDPGAALAATVDGMQLPQLPRWLLWDHNAHYHPWLMRRVPARCERALDVGCGAGALARRLAARVGTVDAVDRSDVMIGRARATAGGANVRWLLGDVLDGSLPLDTGGYDVVTAVSSLHHMPLRPALMRLSALVRPGGVLAVVGCYRPAAVGDYLVDAFAVPANLVVGAVLAARGRAGKPHNEDMPVKWPPDTTLADIRDAAAELLPGARVRRLLFFRYGLEWTG